MPRYFFKAKSLKGEKEEGFLEARDTTHLAKELKEQGLILIEARLGEGLKGRMAISLPFFKGVSLVEKILFTRNLKIMIGAGVSLPKSLETLAAQTKSKRFKEVLSGIKESVLKGMALSESLLIYPEVFPEIFCNMVRVGEEGGRLQEALEVLARQMEREHEMKSKIKGAMIYPMVIIGAMGLIGLAMLILVVPKISETFVELGIELPPTTRFVIFLGETIINKWYLFLAAIPILVFCFWQLKKIKKFKEIIDGISLRIPIISPIVKKINSAYTVRILSSLIISGVGILRSLELTSKSLSNIYYKEAMEVAAEEVKKGKKLSEILLRSYQKIYSPMVIQMIGVGEETGQTGEILGKLADFLEEEVTNTTKNLSAIIEPMIMLLIGGIVGFFAISMIQPMYSMLGAVK